MRLQRLIDAVKPLELTVRIVNTHDEDWDQIDTDVREVRAAVLVVELEETA